MLGFEGHRNAAGAAEQRGYEAIVKVGTPVALEHVRAALALHDALKPLPPRA